MTNASLGPDRGDAAPRAADTSLVPRPGMRDFWPWLVLVVALATSFAFVRWLESDNRDEAASQAREQARRVIDAFEADLGKLELTMRGIVSTLSLGIPVDQAAFAHYVDGLDLNRAYDGAIMSVGFAERVERQALPQHLARMRHIDPGYATHPESDQAVMYPIVLLRRAVDTQVPSPLGFDPYTNPERRAPMDEALARRGIAYSGTVVETIPKGFDGTAKPDSAPGVLMVAPVFPRDPTAPHAGFVGIALHPERLLAGILGESSTVGATLTVSHGESGPLRVHVGAQPEPANTIARQSAEVAHGGSRWSLDVVVANAAPSIPGLLPVLVAASLLLFGASLVIERERRRARTALADAQAEGDLRFRQFADGAPFLVWLCDATMRPTYVNATWTEMTGLSGETALGKGWEVAVHPQDLDAIKDTLRQTVRSPAPVTLRARTRMRDGTYRWFLADIRPMRDRDGGHAGFVGISLDVHDLKSAEMALERERALLRAVLDGSPGAIFAKDAERRYILTNDKVGAFFGVDPSAVLGSSDPDLFPPEMAERSAAQDDRVLKEGLAVRTQEVVATADGRPRWVLETLNPVTLPSGERMLVGWAMDITDLKRLELEAATARKRLEVLNQLAARTLAGASTEELKAFVVTAVEGLIDGARARLLQAGELELATSAPAAEPAVRDVGHVPVALAQLRAGHPVVLPGEDATPVPSDEAHTLLPGGVRSRILAPLSHHGRLHAVLSVEAADERDWTPDEIRATIECADALLAALEICESRTERDRTDTALRESQALLKGIIDALPFGLTVKDEMGRWIVASEKLAEMVGRTVDDLLGRTNRQLYPAELSTRFDLEDAEALASDTPVATEWKITNPATTTPWVVKVKSGVTLPDGRRFLISAFMDVTPQKQAAQEIERGRRFLDTLLNALPQPVYVRDASGRMILVNAAYCHLTQRSRSELIGLTNVEIYGEVVGAMLDAQDREAWDAGEVIEFEQRSLDPRVVATWQMKTKAPVTMPDGSRYLVCMSRDITPLKEAITELERSKQFVESLIDAIPQGIFVKDVAGRWILVNEPFLRMTDRGREQIMGRTNREIYGPVHGARFDQQDAAAWNSNEPLIFEEESPTTASGATWQLKSKAAARMADGSRYLVCTITDSTDRHRADVALQRNRAFLNAIIDAVPALIVVKDADHRFLTVNKAGERMFDRPAEQVIGLSDDDFNEDKAYVAQAWAEDDRVLATGEPITIEHMMTFRGQAPRWVLKTKVATTLEDGTRCVIVVTLDITERKRAEQQALDARTRLEILNGIAADMTADVAFPELVTHAMARMYGASGDVTGCFWVRSPAGDFELTIRSGATADALPIGSSLAAATAPALQSALERGEVVVIEDLHADSPFEAVGATVCPVRGVIAVPIRSAGAAKARALLTLCSMKPRSWREHERQTATDVGEALALALLKAEADGEHARIERELRDREAVLRATVWASDLGMWAWDMVSSVVHFSERWKSQLGFAPDELPDTFDTWVERLHPDDLEQAQARVRSAVESREERYESEFRMRHKDGTWRSMLARAQIQRDADGQPIRMVGGHIDVTDYRKAQEDLRLHRDELEQRVAERTAEAVRAKELAEAANRAKSEFLANMSHELRTPMHAILSFSRLGQDRLATGTAQIAKIGTYLGRIEQSGHRLLSLLNDLLDLSKLESGKMRYDFATHDLRDVVAGLVEELSAYARERNVRLATRPTPDAVAVFCDAERVGQVVRNLLSNAIKFTGAGTAVSIEIETDRTIAQPDGTQRPAALVRVTDEGIGIPEGELERVFDKFIQSSTTTSGAGGTGLGLAICREIANHHGGRIWADNNPGKGAQFTLLLPLDGPADLSPGDAADADEPVPDAS